MWICAGEMCFSIMKQYPVECDNVSYDVNIDEKAVRADERFAK